MAGLVDRWLERLPEGIDAALAEREAWRTEIANSDTKLEFLLSTIRAWPAGDQLRVGFSGGTIEHHQAVAQATVAITQGINLGLDFGFGVGVAAANPGQPFRSWSKTDTRFSAEIRIGFKPGCAWSLVGTDSIDRTVNSADGSSGGAPFQQSMNFDPETELGSPAWDRMVRHEFLHALGFEHEHQNLSGPCATEFRWEDDEGYIETTIDGAFVVDEHGRRPGIYTHLSGAPNRWSRDQVDANMRTQAQGDFAEFDRESIMLYRFPDMYYRSVPSACAPVGDGATLSAGDRDGLQQLYPSEASTVAERRIKATDTLAALHQHDSSGLVFESMSDDSDSAAHFAQSARELVARHQAVLGD